MDLRREQLVYEGPDGPFEGWICWDGARSGHVPGVMVIHAFGGLSEFEVEKATALAKLGYVGFAADLYGQGRRAGSPDEARALMAELDQDRSLLGRRVNAALETMKNLPQVDPDKTAAIGFCFGGKCVLDLARSGADTRGIVSFHGLYDAPPGEGAEPIRAAILALHGWDDPLSPPESVAALARELTGRGADWQLQAYGHTGHSFTNPKAQAPEQGLAYHPGSDRRAWLAMKLFLKETFGGDAG